MSFVLALGVVLAGCQLLVGQGAWPTGWSASPTEPIAAFADATGECLPGHGPVLQDQRGPDGAAFLRIGAESDALCFIAQVGIAHDPIVWDSSLPSPESEDLPTVTWAQVGDPSVVVGGHPAGAAQVIVTTTGGERVTASMLDGRYLAWWPTGDAVARVEAVAADGTILGVWGAGQD